MMPGSRHRQDGRPVAVLRVLMGHHKDSNLSSASMLYRISTSSCYVIDVVLVRRLGDAALPLDTQGRMGPARIVVYICGDPSGDKS